jgi:hypothetical protein
LFCPPVAVVCGALPRCLPDLPFCSLPGCSDPLFRLLLSSDISLFFMFSDLLQAKRRCHFYKDGSLFILFTVVAILALLCFYKRGTIINNCYSLPGTLPGAFFPYKP